MFFLSFLFAAVVIWAVKVGLCPRRRLPPQQHRPLFSQLITDMESQRPMGPPPPEEEVVPKWWDPRQLRRWGPLQKMKAWFLKVKASLVMVKKMVKKKVYKRLGKCAGRLLLKLMSAAVKAGIKELKKRCLKLVKKGSSKGMTCLLAFGGAFLRLLDEYLEHGPAEKTAEENSLREEDLRKLEEMFKISFSDLKEMLETAKSPDYSPMEDTVGSDGDGDLLADPEVQRRLNALRNFDEEEAEDEYSTPKFDDAQQQCQDELWTQHQQQQDNIEVVTLVNISGPSSAPSHPLPIAHPKVDQFVMKETPAMDAHAVELRRRLSGGSQDNPVLD